MKRASSRGTRAGYIYRQIDNSQGLAVTLWDSETARIVYRTCDRSSKVMMTRMKQWCVDLRTFAALKLPAVRSRIFAPAKREGTTVHYSLHSYSQPEHITQATYAQYS